MTAMKVWIVCAALAVNVVIATLAGAYTWEDRVQSHPADVRLKKYLHRLENRVRALEVQAGIKTAPQAPPLTKQEFKIKFKGK